MIREKLSDILKPHLLACLYEAIWSAQISINNCKFVKVDILKLANESFTHEVSQFILRVLI